MLRIATLVGLVVVSSVLFGCSGDSSETTQAPPPSADAVPEEPKIDKKMPGANGVAGGGSPDNGMATPIK